MHGGNARGCLVPILVVVMLALSGCAGLPFGGNGGDGQPDGRIGPYERVEDPETLTANPPTTDAESTGDEEEGSSTGTPTDDDQPEATAPAWYPPGVTNDSVGPPLARAHVQALSGEYFVVTENVSYRYPGSDIKPYTERRRLTVTPNFAVVEREDWTTFLNESVSYERYGGDAGMTYLQASGSFATSTFAQYSTLRTVFEAAEWAVTDVRRDGDGDRVLVLRAEEIVDTSAVAEQFGIPWLDDFSGTVRVATDGFVRSATMNLTYTEGTGDRRQNLSVKFDRYGYIDVPRPDWVTEAAATAVHANTTVREANQQDERSDDAQTNGTIVTLAVEDGAAVPSGARVMLSNRTGVWSTTLDAAVEPGEAVSVALTRAEELTVDRNGSFEQVADFDGTLSLRVLEAGRLLVSRELDAGPLVD